MQVRVPHAVVPSVSLKAGMYPLGSKIIPAAKLKSVGGRVGAIIAVEPAALHTFFGPVENLNVSEIILKPLSCLQGKYTPIL